MYRSHAYESITGATIVISIIIYGLIRGYQSGKVLLVARGYKVFDRTENPLGYWFCFTFYLGLIALIISMTWQYARSNW